MKKGYLLILNTVWGLLVASCNPYNPSPQPVAPKEYAKAYVEAHGQCYDSIQASVLSLDLYSVGLELDSAYRMRGSGYNLYLSDIFVTDSLLSPGSYTTGTTGEQFSFLPGKNYEGLPTGTYLLQVADGALTSITLMDSGRMEVRDTADGIVDIRFTLYHGRETYDAHFQGPLSTKQDE